MSRSHWKTKRIGVLLTSFFVIYLTVKVKNYEHSAAVFLPEVQPSDAWDYVADFGNMKHLNPTIVHFNIINESGNYEQWKYSAEYSEYLSHWPHLSNKAIAHFNVKANPKHQSYFIESLHQTCLFSNMFCLDSMSEFKFSQGNTSEGTLCEENIIYQCPAILSWFCRREVVYQREAIMKNLKSHFDNKL